MNLQGIGEENEPPPSPNATSTTLVSNTVSLWHIYILTCTCTCLNRDHRHEHVCIYKVVCTHTCTCMCNVNGNCIDVELTVTVHCVCLQGSPNSSISCSVPNLAFTPIQSIDRLTPVASLRTPRPKRPALGNIPSLSAVDISHLGTWLQTHIPQLANTEHIILYFLLSLPACEIETLHVCTHCMYTIHVM